MIVTISINPVKHAIHISKKPGIYCLCFINTCMFRTRYQRYDYAPMKEGNVHFHIGSESADYNSESGLNSSLNSLVSLLFRRNYLKLYHQNHAYLSNRIDLTNGLNLSATLGYKTAQPLNNYSDYSFFFRGEREYSPHSIITGCGAGESTTSIQSILLYLSATGWQFQAL